MSHYRLMYFYCFISLLFSFLLFLTSCASKEPGPDVKLWVIKNEKGGLYRKQDGGKTIPFKEAENYISLNPRDAEALVNFCLAPTTKAQPSASPEPDEGDESEIETVKK